MKDEALRQALDYIIATNKNSTFWLVPQSELNKTVTAIKQALKQPEPEPVVTLEKLEQEIYENTRRFVDRDVMEWMLKRYYTSPPKREWQGLTDDEIWKFWWSRPEVSYGEDDSMEAEFVVAVRRILAAHGIKEKNT